jgi:hypothetical protein
LRNRHGKGLRNFNVRYYLGEENQYKQTCKFVYMQNLLLCFSLLCTFHFPVSGFSQTAISGMVKDEKGKTIPAASVFLAGTSFGTVANEKGRFNLSGIPPGKYDLVVSCVGFQTFSTSLDTRQPNDALEIVLNIKSDELENVTIGPGEEVPWEKWGSFFIENFIGIMPGAEDCKIENPKVIRFRHHKKQQLIRATASNPLIITNKTLGYEITYQLEYFQYDFASKIVHYLGYPLFKEMNSKNERRRQLWEENRMNAYYGSLLHFSRSMYQNTLSEDGFELRKLVKQPNHEKERVKNIMREKLTSGGTMSVSINGSNAPLIGGSNGDSGTYYQQVLSQPNAIDVLYKTILPADSIAFQINNYTVGMEFSDYLHITYIKAKEHPQYLLWQGRENQKPGDQISTLNMTGPGPLEIASLGQLNDPLLIICSGYWGWKDKIAMMLPFDFNPHVHENTVPGKSK